MSQTGGGVWIHSRPTKRRHGHATSAGAALYIPQTTHRTLLTKKSQKPTWRRVREDDATNQAADTVTSIAGHCNAEIHGSNLFSVQGWCCPLKSTSTPLREPTSAACEHMQMKCPDSCPTAIVRPELANYSSRKSCCIYQTLWDGQRFYSM
jgi:hypothetical protein